MFWVTMGGPKTTAIFFSKLIDLTLRHYVDMKIILYEASLQIIFDKYLVLNIYLSVMSKSKDVCSMILSSFLTIESILVLM